MEKNITHTHTGSPMERKKEKKETCTLTHVHPSKTDTLLISSFLGSLQNKVIFPSFSFSFNSISTLLHRQRKCFVSEKEIAKRAPPLLKKYCDVKRTRAAPQPQPDETSDSHATTDSEFVYSL